MTVQRDETPEGQGLELQKKITGQVLAPADADFEAVAGDVWNKYGPVTRRPELIVRVADQRDVMEAVRFAKANRLRVAIRGGGHHWANPTLRQGGLLIDLARLNRVVSVDAASRRAVVEPVVSNRDVQAALNARNLAFPSGHCPPVKLSGYLLSGGMSWNQGVWGPGVGSVEAIELVTADGEAILADKDHNADYFWAARGAGPGFFGVVTRYHLKLYDLPRAMAASAYYYPVVEVGVIARWLESLAGKLPPALELSLFLLAAPPSLAHLCAPGDAGKVCLVAATIFADSREEAMAALSPLEECPVRAACLSRTFAAPTDFPALFDASGALWPAEHHNQVEAMFSNAPLGDVFDAVRDHFLRAPSPVTLLMFAIFTGPDVPAALPDAAFSMSARYYGGPWTMWPQARDSAANTAWHRECLRLLRPSLAGHYIGETDIAVFPEHVRESFAPGHWDRLQALRQKYDPDGVFFSYFDGLR